MVAGARSSGARNGHGTGSRSGGVLRAVSDGALPISIAGWRPRSSTCSRRDLTVPRSVQARPHAVWTSMTGAHCWSPPVGPHVDWSLRVGSSSPSRAEWSTRRRPEVRFGSEPCAERRSKVGHTHHLDQARCAEFGERRRPRRMHQGRHFIGAYMAATGVN